MKYAIIEAGGKQIWIEQGKFYDVNYIHSQPGDIVQLKRVLLANSNNKIHIGYPCINKIFIQAKIIKHLKAKKINVFKMKPKKNKKSKQGHRQKLTRLLIENIINC